MNSISDHEWARAAAQLLLPRLAVQAAAELLEEAISRDDEDAIEAALRLYRAALAMVERP